MTNEEAIIHCEYRKDYATRPQKVALDMAIKALEKQGKLLETLAEAELLHPYKIYGKAETYSDYNQGWCDALDYIDSRMHVRDSEVE